jgi:GAF domain-containing protein
MPRRPSPFILGPCPVQTEVPLDLDAAPFARLARELSSYGDRAATVDAIAQRAVETLGCTRAAVARATGDSYTFEAITDEVVLPTVEHIAKTTQQGPALSALRDKATVLVDDVRQETRWPDYCALLAELTPIRSALGFYLELDGVPLGVLMFYEDEQNWFTDDRIDLGSVYADHATVALAKAAEHDHAAHLTIALQTNRIIAEAIGILMSTYKINEQHAFDLLRLASQHTNRKLRDVAADVAHTGALPEPSPARAPR